MREVGSEGSGGGLRAWEAGCRQSARLCVGRGARGVRAAEACTFLCHPWLCPSLRAQLTLSPEPSATPAPLPFSCSPPLRTQ